MNTEVQHYGPLGLDDFPTNLKVTCTLKRGKPRDLREIEKMYMHGNDRIYFSMGPKVMDMYKSAAEYKRKHTKSPENYNSLETDIELQKSYAEFLKSKEVSSADDEVIAFASTGEGGGSMLKDNTAEAEELGAVFLTDQELATCGNIVQKWFGEHDDYSIYFAAAEQENGASKKKEKPIVNGSEKTNNGQNTKGNNTQ